MRFNQSYKKNLSPNRLKKNVLISRPEKLEKIKKNFVEGGA
jgi:hypothetical protein